MIPWYIWIVAGFACGILEMLTADFFFMSVGIGAIFAGILALLGLGTPWQIFALIVGILVIFFGVRPFFKNRITHPAKFGVDALVGQEAWVLETITERTPGQIKLQGQEWKAKSTIGVQLEKNTLVIVDRIDGATAYVSKLEV